MRRPPGRLLHHREDDVVAGHTGIKRAGPSVEKLAVGLPPFTVDQRYAVKNSMLLPDLNA